MTRRTTLFLVCVAICAVGAGCGQRTATVAGKVTYQGKPVVWGSITLRATDGTIHQIGINPDGTYRLDGVPVGPAQVGVSSPDPKPSARAGRGGDDRVPVAQGPPPGTWYALPAKYVEPATSGVSIQVGGASADVDLK